MAWWQFFGGASKNRTMAKPKRTRPTFETLEERATPAGLNSYETHALAVVNAMRANPAAFGNELRQLFLGGNYQSTHGYAANDPVWADLHDEIIYAEQHSTWRSGFTSSGSGTFLNAISSMPAVPSIAWTSSLQDGAIGHNSWMFTNAYAHSNFEPEVAPFFFESPSDPIPGISRNFNVQYGDYFSLSGFGTIGENISYGYNILPKTFQAYRNGQLSAPAFIQRLVYADVIGFAMEYNNNSVEYPFGHLQNLVGYRNRPGGIEDDPLFNVMGLSVLTYNNPIESYNDPTPQSYFGTHRFGVSSNSYTNVLVYQDLNNDNFYQPGEGIPAQVSYASNVAGGQHNGSASLNATGFTSFAMQNAFSSYTVSVVFNGNTIGTQTVSRNGNNQSVTIKYNPSPPIVVPSGLRTSEISFASDGSWWAIDGVTGATKRLTQWASQAAANWQYPNTGDFNGDGRTDLTAYANGQWWVALQTATGFTTTLWTSWSSAVTWTDITIADQNNDGRADIFARWTEGGQWYAAVSNGSTAFNNVYIATWYAGAGWHDTQIGDLNGDGRADIVSRTAAGQWWQTASNGTNYVTSFATAWTEAAGWRDVKGVDLNGDGRMDLVGRTAFGQWWASLNTVGGWANSLWASWTESAGWRDVVFGDFNNDNKIDVAARTAGGQWYVGINATTAFSTTLWTTWTEAGWANVIVGDWNGDSRADIAARSGSSWWLATSTGSAFTTRFLANLNIPYVFAKFGRVEGDIFNT